MQIVPTNVAKTLDANVNVTSYYDVINSVYPVTMTTIRLCSILEFSWGASNQAVAPGITRPLHATAWGPKAQTGGAEGAQAPSLAIRILMFIS